MNNPWSAIGAQGIHPDDRHYADKHNKSIARSKPKQLIESYLSPLPYLGDPRTARVVLLGKNPSFAPVDEQEAIRLPALTDENIKALTFESDHPLFYLDERFAGTAAHGWWNGILGEVIAACSAQGQPAEVTAKRIAAAQYHPYRSAESFVPKEPFPTQAYTFHLLREAARDPNRVFVVLYGAANERMWREAVPNLPQTVVRLKSAQAAKLSPGNMSAEYWQLLLDRLCAP